MRVAAWAMAWVSLIAIILGAMVTSLPQSEVRAAETPVTYSRQIAPIVYRSCSGCHHAGGSGPFALTSYAEAKRWGGAMETVTTSRYMPPWLPTPGHGEFAESRRLPEEEIALIKRWVQEGMPEGDTKDAPKPPTYDSQGGSWALGPPDLVVEAAEGLEVPAAGTDVFENVIFPVPLDTTRWVRAMEIKPGAAAVVHHANLMVDRTASLRRMHPADWKHGIPGMDVTLDSGDRFSPDSHFLNWKPDSQALVEGPEMPWRLDPGNDLVLNLHLKPTGKAEAVRARVGLYFASQPATQLPILVELEHDAALDIPAGATDFVVDDHLRMPVDVEALAIYPHAHYLGKRMEGWAELPNGRREDLILIESWDINRQAIYRFARPVLLPKGTVVRMRYTYDNSAANPHNPSSPPVRVRAGNRSDDEMGHLWLQLLPTGTGKDGGGAEGRAPILQAWMERRLEKDPGDGTAMFNLASLKMMTGDFGGAATGFTRVLAVQPGDVRTEVALGSALAAEGQWAAARDQFQEAIAKDGSFDDARYDLGVVDLEHEQFAEAEAQFRALLLEHPRDVAAENGLGSALLAEDRTEEARATFKAAVAADSKSFDALFNLGRIAAEAGQIGEAIGYLERAEVERPEDAETHQGLAAMLAQVGREAEARREAALAGKR